ncbi:hypothetical protein [Mycobacterium sp. DL440]|uniref:hypothetical protein n=1 Tax=Mycobacterium sp. DL440 TaxID=2675523 RepID=UPI001423C9D9|nr:hypothetical protein [Mycobacterium sp. DL440]
MLRTTLAAAAAVCTLVLIGAPVATADPHTKHDRSSQDASPKVAAKAPDVKPAPTPPGRKGDHDLTVTGPRLPHKVARKQTKDRYFEQRREQTLQKIQDWFDQH